MDRHQFQQIQSRRSFFRDAPAASAPSRSPNSSSAMDAPPPSRRTRSLPSKPHFPAKAKNVIFLFMEGGPSQIDLFDPKPALQKLHGQPLPPDDQEPALAFIKPNAAVLASPRTFTPYGQCGMEFSDYIPHIGSCADDHLPGALHVHRRLQPPSRPVAALRRQHSGWAARPWARGCSTGSAASRRTCPASSCSARGVGTSGGASNWSSGFLPSTYQGVVVPQLGRSRCSTSPTRRASPATCSAPASTPSSDLNEDHYAQTGDVEIASRIASYELAFRMQMAAPELLDFSKESPETLEMLRRQRRAHQAVRHQLPAGPPHGGARRALRHADPRQLGRPHRPQHASSRRTATSPTSPPPR